MFCGERLGKLVLIQATRSASVRMLEGGMRVPSFALVYGRLESVVPTELGEVAGHTPTNNLNPFTFPFASCRLGGPMTYSSSVTGINALSKPHQPLSKPLSGDVNKPIPPRRRRAHRHQIRRPLQRQRIPPHQTPKHISLPFTPRQRRKVIVMPHRNGIIKPRLRRHPRRRRDNLPPPPSVSPSNNPRKVGIRRYSHPQTTSPPPPLPPPSHAASPTLPPPTPP